MSHPDDFFYGHGRALSDYALLSIANRDTSTSLGSAEARVQRGAINFSRTSANDMAVHREACDPTSAGSSPAFRTKT